MTIATFRVMLLTLFSALLLVFSTNKLNAQSIPCMAVDDTVCVNLGEDVTYNVTTNDGGLPPGCTVQLKDFIPCIDLRPDGLLMIAAADSCCGEYMLRYEYQGPCVDAGADCSAIILLTVKCPKPDCYLTNLDDFSSLDPTGGPPECAAACEDAEAIYYVPYVSGNTYSWSVTGGTFTTGGNPAEIIVTWGPMGAGLVTLTITDPFSVSTTQSLCVDILESPIAAFQPLDTCVCKNGPISFQNLTVGASSYYWDFGDGNTSTAFEPTHTYTSPGTYTVTLYATRDNYAADGSPLCCCSDSVSMDITVDSLEGPNIYWISTLCEDDSSKYWTDATNCGTYNWTVTDSDGAAVSFSGNGNDTICVAWGDGPYGIVTLEVSGCDSAYCSKPSSALVPIIPDTADIAGPTLVCEGASETYTLPKWISTYYDWNVTGGTVTSGNGTNTVTIQWGSAAGSPGTITVNYYSEFLAGLPIHSPPDCEGIAELDVLIKPEFSINGPIPGTVCLGSTSFFSTSPSGSFTWNITPAATFTPSGGGISVTWTAPGNYTVTAVPTDTTLFCNSIANFSINVIEVPPPDSITGPQEICPGETYTYFVHSSLSNVAFNWNVIGGVPSATTGDAIMVTWNAIGPYSITVSQTQLSAPFCTSDTIGLPISPLELMAPLEIVATDGCVNSLQNIHFIVPQHPDTEITWSLSPPTAGSIVSGMGNDSITIQWNNDPGSVMITVTIELCGIVKTSDTNINLISLPPPVITQSNDLCPGVPATLDAGAGYASYSWSTGGSGQSINITTGGDYTVTVTDINGCTATATYTAVELEGPDAIISTPDGTTICQELNPGDSVTLYALTNINYTYRWFCNGVLQIGFSGPTFVHNDMASNTSYTYFAVVQDNSTGCVDTSNTITVFELDSCRGDSACVPEPHSVDITVTNSLPYCNEVNFTVTTFGSVTLGSWNFDDPFGNLNTGTITNAQHEYLEAGYYTAALSYTVPEVPPGTGDCNLTAFASVCVPVGANFDFVDSCGLVCFSDLSTYLPGFPITAYQWTFGDGNFSADPNPKHMYAPGTYTVTLEVQVAGGCRAIYTEVITIPPLPTATISINPNPACVGDSIGFSATGTGIVSWLWDYGDGASNGAQNNAHSYATDGTFPVSLIVVNAAGCSDTLNSSVTVFPLPPEDTITYSPSLVICEGETTTLTAPTGPYTYLWTTGATTPSITVGVGGEYGVTITDANGCMLEIDPVTVTVIPAPVATISGSLFICDDGCTTLSAPLGTGYTYQWTDASFTPIGGATGPTYDACDFSLLSGYAVIVTNPTGCSDTSDVVVVSVVASPAFSINLVGDGCEGTPNVLTVVPVQPNVVYNWSNGGSGPSTTAILAGTVTAIGTDTITGCTGSASVIIHPLPDLCIVPVGCYEVCDPDTICGPPGLAAYQWNLNGLPIPGETGQCLIVTMSGNYSLTGTTSNGCTDTSDSLILEVIDCDTTVCDSVSVMADPIPTAGDSCCWSLDLSNGVASYFIGIQIQALGGADLSFEGSPAGWFTFGSSSSSVTLAPPSLGYIPTGSLADVADFCVENYLSSPQYVVVNWLIPGTGPLGYEIDCTDTLEFNCEPPGCVAIVDDSIYCENDSIKYTFYLENQSLSYFLETIVFNVDPGVAITVSPDPLSIPPLAPGATAGPYTICLSGPDATFGHDFKFTLSAHDGPLGGAPIFCCTDTTLYCIPIPSCDVCDKVAVQAFKDSVDCCFTVVLNNNFADSYFTGITTTLITPGAEFGTVTVPWPVDWVYNSTAPNSIDWDPVPLGSTLPLGFSNLPEICLDGNYPDSTYMVIKWLAMSGVSETVVCCDTVLLVCDPAPDPCVEIINDTIFCDESGKYIYQFQVINNSGYTIDEIDFTGLTPGFSMDSVSVTLADGATSGVLTTCITGPSAIAGNTVCFHVTLHSLLPSGTYFACCSSDTSYCYVLPDCDGCIEDIILDDFATVPPISSVLVDVLANDLCPPGFLINPGSVNVVVPPTNGFIPTITAAGQIGYSPFPGYVGPDAFVYEVCCVSPTGQTSCCEATVFLNVQGLVQDTCDASTPVTGLVATVSGSSVLLEWDPLVNAAGYQIQGRVLGAPSFGTLTAFTNSATVGPLPPGLCFEWQVRAGCNPFPSAIGPFSVLDTFCTTLLRTAETDLIEAVIVPNPASYFADLRITSEEVTHAEITLLDMLGRQHAVRSEPLGIGQTVVSLDVADLPDGIYTVKISTARGEKEVKLAVNH